MSGWKEDISRELDRAREAQKAGNHGKARTCARRAIGIAASELRHRNEAYALGTDFMSQVRAIADDERFDERIREAASRLGARIGRDFSSPSRDPVQDAGVVVSDLVARIEGFQDRSSER